MPSPGSNPLQHEEQDRIGVPCRLSLYQPPVQVDQAVGLGQVVFRIQAALAPRGQGLLGQAFNVVLGAKVRLDLGEKELVATLSHFNTLGAVGDY